MTISVQDMNAKLAIWDFNKASLKVLAKAANAQAVKACLTAKTAETKLSGVSSSMHLNRENMTDADLLLALEKNRIYAFGCVDTDKKAKTTTFMCRWTDGTEVTVVNQRFATGRKLSFAEEVNYALYQALKQRRLPVKST